MRQILFALLLIAGPSAAQTSSEISAACTSATNIPGEICDCMGALATAQLTGDEQAFVLASILEDAETTQDLRETMPVDSLTRASVFLINAPATCASG